MKTYPILRPDGTLHAFEISNAWISMGTIKRLLRSISGVSNLERKWLRGQRLLFTFKGEQCEIWEPFGDSSRYWIGPSETKTSTLDISDLHAVFVEHTNPLLRAWRHLAARHRHASNGASPN